MFRVDESQLTEAEKRELNRRRQPLLSHEALPTTNDELSANILSRGFLYYMKATMDKAAKLDDQMEPTFLHL